MIVSLADLLRRRTRLALLFHHDFLKNSKNVKKAASIIFGKQTENQWSEYFWVLLEMPEYKVFLNFHIIDQGLRKSLLSLQFFRGRYQVWKKSYLNEEFFLDSWVWSARLSRFWHIEKSWIWNMINFSKIMLHEEFKYEEKNCHWNKNLVKIGF